MTTPDDERAYWDAAAEYQANIGGIDMPAPAHYVRQLERWSVGSPWLDLGSGPGRIARLLPRRETHCVDISQAMLDQLPEGLIPHLGDGRTIPLTVPPVTFAWSVLMFQHISRAAVWGYLVEIRRVLQPGGLFVAQWVREGPDHDYSRPMTNTSMMWMADQADLEPVALWPDELVPEWSWGVWTR